MPPAITGELGTLLTAAAFAPLNDRAFLRITGPDATRWLNGMVTNNIQALQPGEGNYNFLLNAQGRIQGDATIYRDPAEVEPTYILETDSTQIDNLHQLLDKFIIMDDVELTRGLHIGITNAAKSPVGMTLLGPNCPELLPKLVTARGDFAPLAPAPPISMTPANFEGHEVLIFTPPAPGSPACEIWCADRHIIKDLYRVLDFHHVPMATAQTLEQLRILEARPRYNTDIRNSETAKDLPQETNQTHALHFAKGCYLGQEIVERIRSRGQVHRQFTPFRLEGAPPSTTFPIPLEANGKPAGELTGATEITTDEGPLYLALGYARREPLETHTPLTYPGGTAHPRSPGSLL